VGSTLCAEAHAPRAGWEGCRGAARRSRRGAVIRGREVARQA